MPIAIGIDIGGTKIKVGLVDKGGQVIGIPETIPTNAHEAGEKIIERLIGLSKRMIQQAGKYQIIGIGIGSTGPLDLEQGIILECNNLPTLHYYPLKEKIEETFRLPVRINNDANAMILGEALWGAGKEADTIVGITLGTGLGAALIHHKKIIKGASGCAGEIWTSPYKEGIIEDYASGTALTRMYRLLTQKEMNGMEIARLARTGDDKARIVWKEFTEALAYALAWTVNMLDPETVILGGSVMRSSNLFWNPMERLFRSFICPATAAHVRLSPAALGDNAGFIGAAALMFIE